MRQRRLRKITSLGIAALLTITLACTSVAKPLPTIKPKADTFVLHVDNEPFVIIGGQTMNSSPFDLEYMKTVWPRMKDFNANTLIVPISWQAVEEVEDVYDFSLVDGLVKQARAHDMKMVMLWFGTWKNARSFYPPDWVISDMDRFKRMESARGQKIEYLSTFSENTLEADSEAFAAFMRHLKEIDAEEQTVLMVQIQNEVGLLGDTRDRSAVANRAFADPVPQELMDYLMANKSHLKPHLLALWGAKGFPTKGNWTEVFGRGKATDEIFMAWQYATYINHIAQQGKAEYALPMFVNAWLGQEAKGVPGKYPSGGPVARVMDIWKAGGPNLDLLAPDIYAFFKERVADFRRDDNPLLIPEATPMWLGDRYSAPALAFYAIGEGHALGFGPFGLDFPLYDEDHPIGVAYETLQNLMPEIIKAYGTPNLRGVLKEGDEKETHLAIGPYAFNIRYQPEVEHGYGLILRTGKNQFIIAGNGIRVIFAPENPQRHPGISVGMVEEGKLDSNGAWQRRRLTGGGETIGAAGVKLPPLGFGLLHNRNHITTMRVNLFLHPEDTGDRIEYSPDTEPEF